MNESISNFICVPNVVTSRYENTNIHCHLLSVNKSKENRSDRVKGLDFPADYILYMKCIYTCIYYSATKTLLSAELS